MNKALTTGKYTIMKRALQRNYLEKLECVANKLNRVDKRPIYIANEEMLGSDIVERYKTAGIDKLIKKAEPIIKEQLGKEWLILTNKALIRRTWPISENESRKLGHNASNLTWHQDSNFKHQDKPMVVLMTPLQSKAGLVRPGLSIMDFPTDKFLGVFGYEGNRVEEFEECMIKRYGELKVKTPVLDAGDLLIFNGLTFHRTFSVESMKKHRDALLVRLIRPEDGKNFPDAKHYVVK